MYCSCCKSDVAAKLDQDDRTLLCTHCGTEIQANGRVNSLNDATRDAQSLLQRWADPQIFDAPSEEIAQVKTDPTVDNSIDDLPIVELAEIQTEVKKTETPIVEELPETAQHFEEVLLETSEIPEQPINQESKSTETKIHHVIDEPEFEVRKSYVVERSDMQILNRPILTSTAFEVQQSINDRHSSKFNWRRFIGQSLAYLGTGILSVGGAAIVWSFYDGPEHIVPAGWIMVFAGQLMLFLGLVTLITSGVKELRSDVVNRVDFIRSLLSRLDPPAQLPEKPQYQARKESRVESRDKSDVVKP